MAITSIGGVAVAMNSLWKPEEMSYGLTDSGAKLLVADEERIDRFNQIEEKLDLPSFPLEQSRNMHMTH